MLVAVMAMALLGQPGQSVLEGRELIRATLVAPPGQNGYDELVEAAALLNTNGTTEVLKRLPQDGDPEWLSSRRKVCDACVKSFDLVHAALSKEVTFSATDANLKVLYQKVEDFAHLSQALTFRATVACADGRPDVAADALADGFLLSNKLGFVGGRDHYFAGEETAINMLWEFARDKRQFTPTGLGRLEKAIDAALANRDTIHVVDFQGTLETSLVRRLTDDPTDTYKDLGIENVEKWPANSPVRIWFEMSKDERKTASDDCIRALKARDDQARAALALQESAWESAGVNKEPPVSKMHVFEPLDWGNWMEEEAQMRTRLRLAKAECKVLAHKWQFGSWPRDLDDAADAKDTTDPQTGKKFLFQLTGKSFGLWAINANGQSKMDMNGAGSPIGARVEGLVR